MTTLFNAGPRAAYQAGNYHGFYTISDLLKHGDYGLGALDGNDGELTISAGQAFRTDYAGTTKLVTLTTRTPYATISPFVPHDEFAATNFKNTTLETKLIHRYGETHPYALRVVGVFDLVVAGAGQRQAMPYRPLSSVFAAYNLIHYQRINGTLIGFYNPLSMKGMNAIGFHYHFLSDNKTNGGHVTTFDIAAATITVSKIDTVSMQLPPAELLAQLDLAPFYA